MNNRRNANRGRARRRRRSPSPDLEEPINLIQLMRRRLRYRPYSVNNPNMRSVIENNRNWYPPFNYNTLRNNIRPLFRPTESLERQDIGINTEIPCCAVHSSFTSRENREIIENSEEIEENSEEVMPDICESLYRLSNSEGVGGKDIVSSKSESSAKEQEMIESKVKPKASESNESKSPDASSSEPSGSSISYTESGHRARKQNLSDIQFPEFPRGLGEFNYDETLGFERNALNFMDSETLDNNLENPVCYEEDTGSLRSESNPEFVNNNDLSNSESVKDLENIETISEHYVFSDEEKEVQASISHNSQTDKSSVEELKEQDTECQETFSTELSAINNPNITLSSELPQSSSDSLEMATTTRFTFVEVHSNISTDNNASGSSLNNEENQETITLSDTEAGGDGHHNDSVINIEFTITAHVHPDNEDDQNNDDEGNEDNESETNNEDQ